MADDKKADKPAPPQTDPFVEIVWWIFGLWIIAYILNQIFLIISSIINGRIADDYPWLGGIWGFILGIVPGLYLFLKFLAILLAVGAVFGIIYLINRLKELRLNESKLLYPEIPAVAYDINPIWSRIIKHIDSENENDWRLAILEADIMLGTLLESLSLPGDSIGEKLKAVEKSDFTTIDNAWEAHKIRNQIAHEGSAFLMTQREAKRVIALYQTVFEEFHII